VDEPQRYHDPQRHESSRAQHLRTPTSQLTHEEKLRRQQLHMNALTGALVLVLLMLGYAAAFDLDHPAEWIVLGGICFTAVGVMVAVHTAGR
jgi:hypothetical protein